MILSYAFCNVSVMPVRGEPRHAAEQVSQALFGERVAILEINAKNWARIHCEWDAYEGWCNMSQLTTISHKENRKPARMMATGHHDKLVVDGSEISLPIGAELFGIKKLFPDTVARFKGKKCAPDQLSWSAEHIRKYALSFLHAPYLWGGRSRAGIDCSGLSQVVFKLCGKKLPRDAWQQANEGEIVDFLQHAACGDLAFFDNDEERITHVGILLDCQTIIHATETAGHVVIDSIDQGGIISRSLRKRTHNLRLVKRYSFSS